MPQQIQLRRGTRSAWTTANPTLAAGELGVETDTLKFKVGNGSSAWAGLAYASLAFQGAYAGGTAYYPGDIVTYNGSAYVNILTSTGNLPTNTTYFSVLASKGDTGATGPQGSTGATGDTGPQGPAGTSFTFQGAWSSATAYAVNDVVVRNSQTYISIQAGTNQDPATQTAYWTLMAAKGADGEVSLTGAQTLTNKTITSAKYTVSALGSISGAQTLDLAAATEFTATLTGATTLSFSNAPGAGSGQVVYLRLTNAGATTITWPANTKFAGGTAPTLTSSGVDVLAVKYDLATTTYQVFVIGLDVK